MQVEKVKFTHVNSQNKLKMRNKIDNQQITSADEKAKLPGPSAAQILSFTGGYSLNLAETIKHLDKLASKKSDVYPPQIQEGVGLLYEEGHKTKKKRMVNRRKSENGR